MKKLFFALMAMGISAAVMAQTPAQVRKDQEKKAESKDLRTDVRAHKVAKHKENKDLAHVRVKKAMHDHKAVSRVNKDEHYDAKRLKAHGVDHPVTKARRQVRVQDDNRKDHTQ
ncbi:MAG TPA: hypothetical protein VG605_04200 [Puia sp.]|nr:hypothetical protein [Puia sp.]